VAYLSGAAISTVLGTAVAFAISETLGSSDSGSSSGSNTFLDWIFVVLLAILAITVYLQRGKTEPPKWMGKLQAATPAFAFRLGLTLFIAMPTDILTMFTVGGYLSAHDESLATAIPFFLLTSLLVGLPLLVLLAMGHRAQTTLPRLRDWMNANSWVVSEIVIAFFIVLELKDALGA
jgi:hypothetical protein